MGQQPAKKEQASVRELDNLIASIDKERSASWTRKQTGLVKKRAIQTGCYIDLLYGITYYKLTEGNRSRVLLVLGRANQRKEKEAGQTTHADYR